MLDRIRAAYSVLRGTHKAVPMTASWSPIVVYPTTATATSVTWTVPGS